MEKEPADIPDDQDRDDREAVIESADDTGMVSGEAAIVRAELENGDFFEPRRV
jgi:hypothetical protein